MRQRLLWEQATAQILASISIHFCNDLGSWLSDHSGAYDDRDLPMLHRRAWGHLRRHIISMSGTRTHADRIHGQNNEGVWVGEVGVSAEIGDEGGDGGMENKKQSSAAPTTPPGVTRAQIPSRTCLSNPEEMFFCQDLQELSISRIVHDVANWIDQITSLASGKSILVNISIH